jgi:protein O-mannosyl-transferase
LELYFEHRNYLPAMLLFWPLAHALARWHAPWAWRAAPAIALLALLSAITWQRAEMWGDPSRMARVWAAQNPDSPRAQATAAMALVSAGRPKEATSLLLPRWRADPHEPQLAFNYVDSRCAAGGVTPEEVAAVAETLRHTSGGHMLVHRWLRNAIGTAAVGACPGLTLDVVDDWLQAAMANPALTANNRLERDLLPLLGTLALQRDAPDDALHQFEAALANWPTHEFAAALVAQLGAHGHPAHGLALLDRHLAGGAPMPPRRGMARLHDRVLSRQGYWTHEFSALRGKLLADSEGAGAPASSAPSTGELQDTP